MGTPSKTKDFFISYTEVDVEWAKWIAAHLEAAGYTTTYQERDFNPGSNFVVQMHHVMQQTKRTIAVLSPEYLQSKFGQAEWADAIRRDPTGEYALLVPVRVKDCKVDGLLGGRIYIDLVGLDDAAATSRLLEQIQNVVNRPLPSISGTLIAPAASAEVKTISLPPTSSPVSNLGPGTPDSRRQRLITLVSILVLGMLLGGLLLALGLAGIGPFTRTTSSHQTTPTATPKRTSTPTPGGFRSYIDYEGGFSIKYPSGWSVENASSGTGKNFLGPAKQKFQVSNLGAPSGTNVSDAVNEFCLGACFSPGNNQTSVTLDGLRWTREECDNTLVSAHVLVEGVAYKGNIYLLSYSSPPGSFTSNRNNYFTQMEQSFKFLL